MFTIKPADRTSLEKIFRKFSRRANEKSGAVVAADETKTLGYCIFEHDGYNIEILDIEYPQDDMLLGDGLIRAALNIAAGRGAYTAICKNLQMKPLLENLNLQREDNIYKGEIPEILAVKCHF